MVELALKAAVDICRVQVGRYAQAASTLFGAQARPRL
jgi:hypothetical protein